MKANSQTDLALIPDVIDFFQLGKVVSIDRIALGIGNRNYEVTTDSGEFVVKILSPQSIEVLPNDLYLQQQVKEKLGVLSAEYVSNRDGEKVFASSKLTAVVSSKVLGLRPKLVSSDLAFSIGKLLAQFHTTITTLPQQKLGWMHPGSNAARSPLATDLTSQTLPQGVTHGDMHQGNILVNPEQTSAIVALFDFEEAGMSVWLIDLARSILAVCANANDTNRLDPELMRAEMAGYESVRPLTSEEKQLLPVAITYASHVCCEWFRSHGFEKYIESHQLRVANLPEFYPSSPGATPKSHKTASFL